MITLVKVNVLTDDEAIPTELRDKVLELLRDLVRDDPEGQEYARVSLEWKHTVHNRDYMDTLPATAHAERISIARDSTKKPAAKRHTRATAGASR